MRGGRGEIRYEGGTPPAPTPKPPPTPPHPPPIQRSPRERRRERPDDVLMAASQGDSTTNHRSPRLAGVLSLSKGASQNPHLTHHPSPPPPAPPPPRSHGPPAPAQTPPPAPSDCPENAYKNHAPPGGWGPARYS